MQGQSLHNVLKVVKRMTELQQWRAVCYIDHQLYDETQLCVRLFFDVDDKSEPQKGRIYVVESSWTMLIQRLPSQLLGDQEAMRPEYFILQGHNSPAVRGTASTTGETTYKVLQSVGAPPEDVPKLFDTCMRLTETDSYGGNYRAEALWLQAHPGWQHLHLHCLCHRVHSAAVKAWDLHSDTVPGVIHTCKLLFTSGAMAKLKSSVTKIVSQKLMILPGQCHDEDALRYRQKVLDVWQRSDVLIHHCTGASCCASAESSVEKAQEILDRLISALRPKMFSRANWLEWLSSLTFFGILSGLHSILMQGIQLAFEKEAGIAERDLENMMPLLEGQVLGAGSEAAEVSGVGSEEASPFIGAVGGAGNAAEVDEEAVQRAQLAYSTKTAMTFARSSVFDKVFALRVSLEPERSLMSSLLYFHWC